ncbi:hypothetical protein EDD15DRAFT_2277001 [Pisolithus albus]|nr:hypothetical protein EDD15DRAFT_2277001 [Pisolithus albus]
MGDRPFPADLCTSNRPRCVRDLLSWTSHLHGISVKATALLSCEGSSPEEPSFTEGNVLTIVDLLESDWGRAEWDGVVYAMPAAYVGVSEG